MDIPLETVNSSPICHFNSFCFTALQRLKGCHWNSNGYNSAFWGGRRGQASSSKAEVRVARQGGQAFVLLLYKCANSLLWNWWFVSDWGSLFFTREALGCILLKVQLLSGAGNLHSPSPCCLEPCLQICITRLNSCFFSPWKHFECDIEPKCTLISTSFKFLSSPSLAESTFCDQKTIFVNGHTKK